MRMLALFYAIAKMASMGELHMCEQVWASDASATDIPAVACGKHEEPIDPAFIGKGYTEVLTWYDVVCTPDGCWR